MPHTIVCLYIDVLNQNDYLNLCYILHKNHFAFYDATHGEQKLIKQNPTLECIEAEYEGK